MKKEGKKSRDTLPLMGQCQENFDNFSLLKKFQPRPHLNRQKRFRELFRFREDIRSQS